MIYYHNGIRLKSIPDQHTRLCVGCFFEFLDPGVCDDLRIDCIKGNFILVEDKLHQMLEDIIHEEK
jgi:hypothetical protein